MIRTSVKMFYIGNDAKWCSWMCTALLIGYICKNSAAFCKMEALGRCLATHSARSRATGGQERHFLKFLPLLHDRSRICLQRPGKEKKERLFSFCAFFRSDCYWQSNRMQDWRSVDQQFLHSRSLPTPLSELLPEMQGKKMLQQVGSISLAILFCLSSSLTSIFQWGNNKVFPSTKWWKIPQIKQGK